MLNLLRYFETYSLKNLTALPLNKDTKGESTHPFPSITKDGGNPVVVEGNFHPTPIAPLNSFKPMQLQWFLALFSACRGCCIVPALRQKAYSQAESPTPGMELT